ncbi:MAG: protein kinase domain-containing protein, partial [Pseudonocardiaceae bacterium]
LTQTGITGTPAYLAPDVAARGESSPASDIFSLGATLYAAVEGQPPFGTDNNAYKLLDIVRTGIIRHPTHAGPLEPLLLRLLQPAPTTRPDAATTRDLLSRLAHSAEQVPSNRARPLRALRWWWSRRWRKPARPVMVTAAALTAAAITVVIVLRTPMDPPGNTRSPSAPSLDLAIQNLRDADPCPLLDLDSLQKFGTARQTVGSYLESCEATITAPGHETKLWVALKNPEPVPDIDGTREDVGELVIDHGRQIPYGGRYECSNDLWLAADQPLIYLETRTNDVEPIDDLCAVTNAATATAIAKLEQNGGITHTPNRTSIYSHARTDACATLDGAALGKIPGLTLGDPEPGFAHWSCTLSGDDGRTEVLLEFMLEEPGFDGYDGPQRTLDGKTATLSGDSESCEADVVHWHDPTATTATEMFRISVESPLPAAELCNAAAVLATAVEEQLPG